jgi:hypothetical protein
MIVKIDPTTSSAAIKNIKLSRDSLLFSDKINDLK